MHTKLKGDIGQLIAAAELKLRGWEIAFPYGENLKYDLIVEKDGVFKRIQVKAVTPKNGVLHVNCCSSNNWSVVHYSPHDFEVLSVVNLATKEVYFIPSAMMRKNLFNLRLSPTKNSQKKGVHFAVDFKDI